ncbi:hypothetical protein SteCoe_11019 [Stentor coeruleus]|uniref:Uncharacterized protein n=1 Tax=Stentor coeruleus TaxID=5963 RepID=A0A1R2CE93_9CILI|nr:hypothetical protein SteCoe_11019 [Stentor coeruleus]
MKTTKKVPTKEDFILDSTRLSNKKPDYNSLTDPNLTSFFASPRRRKLLIMQKLVIITQINHTGEINEKLCLKRITNFNTQTIRKTSRSPNLPKKVTKNHILTPEGKSLETKKNSVCSGKLPSIHPMTSSQFKEMLNKRRNLIINNQ